MCFEVCAQVHELGLQQDVVNCKRKTLFAAVDQPPHKPYVTEKRTPRPLWAARLEIARSNKFRSAAEFARHMGLSQQRYALYEKGEREPAYSLMAEICAALGVSVGYVIAGERSDQN